MTIQKRTKKGQMLITNSKAGATLWAVTYSVKTPEIQKIYTKALGRVDVKNGKITNRRPCLKIQKTEKIYSRKQFGFLLHLENKAGKKVIELVNNNKDLVTI